MSILLYNYIIHKHYLCNILFLEIHVKCLKNITAKLIYWKELTGVGNNCQFALSLVL